MRARSALASDERREELRGEFELRTAEQVAETLGQHEGRPHEARPDGQLPRPGPARAGARGAGPAAVRRAADGARAGGSRSSGPSSAAPRSGSSPSGTRCRSRRPRSARCTARVTHDGRGRGGEGAVPRRRRGRGRRTSRTPTCCSARWACCSRASTRSRSWTSCASGWSRSSTTGSRPTTSGSSPTTTPGHPYIHVPERGGPTLSTGRVLTTELAEGARFAEVVRLVRRGARPRRRDALPVRLRQHLPAARVQRRPAPRQLPVPARRPGHVPRLRPVQALHRPTRSKVFEEMIRAMVLDRDIAGVPPASSSGSASCRPASSLRRGRARTTSGTSTSSCWRTRCMDDHPGVRPRETVRRFFDLTGPARRHHEGGQPAAVVRDHPAHQPGPVRPVRRAGRHGATGAASPRSCGRSSTARRRRRWARRSRRGGRCTTGTDRAAHPTDRPGCEGYSTRRMGLPRMAADHVVVSLTPDGKAARTWIQHPVPTLLSHV